MLSPLLLSILSLPAIAEDPKAENDELGPPGTVALEGGRTKIGVDKDVIQTLIDEVPGANGAVRALDAETPEHTVDVDAFFLGLTEVTNEQYAVFVQATGHRPPQEWGNDAIDAASRAFLEEVGKKNQELVKQGKPRLDTRFDRARWWSENWQDQDWAIPAGRELHPVVYVDYSDVTAYCRWAGVRPPTEFEIQHAVRGTRSDQVYPWGEEWAEGLSSTAEDRAHNDTRPVGTFPKGATSGGIFEIAGNVWEWTSSPYVAYARFKKGKYKIDGKRETIPEPTWDGNQRVVVGGCFQTSRLVARCTVRRPTERSQMTNAMGFRVAASVRPGMDIAAAVYEEDVRRSDARPSGVSYLPSQPATMDRWDEAPGSDGTPEGYATITNYEHMVFVPIEEISEPADNPFRRMTLVEPFHLGYLTMSFGLVEPDLPAGTYLVAFRAAGETRFEDEPEPEDAGDAEDTEGQEGEQPARRKREDPWAAVLDIEKHHLLLYDAETAELVVHVESPEFTFGKGTPGGTIQEFEKTIYVEDPEDPEETIPVQEQWLRISYRVATKLSNHGLPIVLEVKPEPGVFEKAWRR